MRSKITLSLAALGLGTALIAAPAFAQGSVSQQSPTSGIAPSGSLSNDQASRPRGDAYAFGAQGQPAGEYHYPVGRAANDGGLAGITPAQAEKGAERTGSNSNRQAFRSGSESYAFGAQGQAPNRAPGAYRQGGLYAYGGAGAAPAGEYHYPVGRAANDGGLAGITPAQAEKGAQRTGSNSNRQAFRSGSESYDFGSQGQPPMSAPGPYGR